MQLTEKELELFIFSYRLGIPPWNNKLRDWTVLQLAV